MGIASPKERLTISIARETRQTLEKTIPKSKRSAFIERAISGALDDEARREALNAILNFKRYPSKGQDSVETLRQLREERANYLAERHSPTHR